MAGKILLVEDEAKIARTLSLYLEQAGYKVTTTQDGALAIPSFRREQPDLILLDIMLPHVDGWEICRKIRAESGVPIILLTAISEETDRILGLELGADDYITKPFSPREVVARAKAVLRRVQGAVQPPQVIRANDVVMDLESYEVNVAGQPITLTPIEFKILAAFIRHPGQVFTRLQLLEQLQDTAYVGYERIIDQHIKNLRAKLGDDVRKPRYIITLYGVGYKFFDQEKADA